MKNIFCQKYERKLLFSFQADKEELDAYLAKMKKRGKPRYEEKAIEEKTSLHSKKLLQFSILSKEN